MLHTKSSFLLLQSQGCGSSPHSSSAKRRWRWRRFTALAGAQGDLRCAALTEATGVWSPAVPAFAADEPTQGFEEFAAKGGVIMIRRLKFCKLPVKHKLTLSCFVARLAPLHLVALTSAHETLRVPGRMRAGGVRA